MKINKVFENNKEWVKSHLNVDDKYFENLAKGQSPEILYIGCSDSRVTAESMMGANPGEVFVLRNIANTVSNLDLSALSVINYAVDHLKVKHIVVCGHYSCGGVKAAMTAADLGTLNPWLRNIRDVYRLNAEELDAITDEDKRYDRLVELNVVENAINTMKTPEVQAAMKRGEIEVHGWVFDIKTGTIIDLKVDFKKVFDKVENIYDLG
ncbi:carbonic anhydrase [Flammeovirga yaeyamensis]|uniref:Carbonic anhydrase 2 n=1 Tax=Flammeovirga yaeyamensis TaxID=367791 RepID=A0AAX1N4D9_9BACT|nr:MULTISPECIES: carbonic anhydrase [Flammeovirga]ANQ50276.1 carbonic anhydrase [Flammeovirga sp. MY04]MBB3699775.1 carbonic anhydrase [Flammeovirga yaeyamensis]NMF36656.1 carbonic anhydrase [Flammeovirga yaeyamensis]QWG02299.1 carbonic anhydrase [Flammeovirga yaeyamensis]